MYVAVARLWIRVVFSLNPALARPRAIIRAVLRGLVLVVRGAAVADTRRRDTGQGLLVGKTVLGCVFSAPFHQSMSLECIFSRESFVAKSTRVRFRRQMDPLVTLQIVIAIETRCADVASKWPIGLLKRGMPLWCMLVAMVHSRVPIRHTRHWHHRHWCAWLMHVTQDGATNIGVGIRRHSRHMLPGVTKRHRRHRRD